MISDPLAEAFAKRLAERRAIDVVWRLLRASTAPSISLAEFVDDVMKKCPWANRNDVAYELRRRLERYQPQRGDRER